MFNKRFKARFIVICSLMVLLIAAGCGGSTDSSSNSTDDSSSSKKETLVSGVDGLGSTYEEVLELAAKENEANGGMVWWGSTPDQNIIDVMVPAFNERFGLDVTVERVGMSAGDVPARLATERTGGQHTVSASGASTTQILVMLEQDLIADVDYMGLFGDELNIEKSQKFLPDELKGKGLEWRHLMYGVVYNTEMVTEEEIPKTWEELTEPQWNRKISLDAGLSPLRRLAAVIGKEKTLDLGQRVLDNKPIFADGSTGTIQKIVAKEAPIGILSLNSAIEQQKKGAPIKIYIPSPLAYVTPQLVFLPKDAPSPNLGALWVAWASTEGMEITAEYGIARARSGEPGALAAQLEKQGLEDPNAALTIESIEAEQSVKKELKALAKND